MFDALSATYWPGIWKALSCVQRCFGRQRNEAEWRRKISIFRRKYPHMCGQGLNPLIRFTERWLVLLSWWEAHWSTSYNWNHEKSVTYFLIQLLTTSDWEPTGSHNVLPNLNSFCYFHMRYLCFWLSLSQWFEIENLFQCSNQKFFPFESNNDSRGIVCLCCCLIKPPTQTWWSWLAELLRALRFHWSQTSLAQNWI